MIDYGTTDAHSNRVYFADSNLFDAPNWYVFFTYIELLATAGNPRWLWSKGADGGAGNGWFLGMNGSERLQVRHRRPGGTAVSSTNVQLTVDSTVHSIGFAFDKNSDYIRFYEDGVFVDSGSLNVQPGGNSDTMTLGNDGGGNGPAVKLGHSMLWIGSQADTPFSLSQLAQIAALYHTGEVIPQPNHLKLWVQGDQVTTILNEITQEVATKAGTINATSDAVDGYFSGEPLVPMYREILSRELRRSRFSSLVHSIPLDATAAAWEIGDDVRLAHHGLPRAASLIANRAQDQMVQSGQPIYCILTGLRFNPGTLEHTVQLEEAEHIMTTFWSTFKLPGGIDTRRDGLAQIGQGASKTFERNMPGWLQQSDGMLAEVGAGLEKMNHQGFLSEGPRKNLLLNSNFAGGLTSVWTDQSAGGGSNAAETDALLFVDSVAYPRVLKLTSGTADSWHEQASISVLSADGNHRIQIWHKELATGYTLSWALQRDSDTQWWNDSTKAWQTTKVWNDLSTITEWGVHYSNPITVSGNQDWKLQVGQQGGIGGAEILVGQVDVQNTHLACSPLVTSSTEAFTGTGDSLKYIVEDDAARQVIYAKRNTARVTLVANQNAADLEDGDILPIFYGQFGSNTNNYLHAYYEKPSSGNARFVYEMQRSGSSDAKAFQEIDMVRGTSYELAFRLTDNSGEELGLRARTLSVLVDGVRGTDARASGDLSTTEGDTELWWGYSNLTDSLRCNNVLADADVSQRVLPDEEILAMR